MIQPLQSKERRRSYEIVRELHNNGLNGIEDDREKIDEKLKRNSRMLTEDMKMSSTA